MSIDPVALIEFLEDALKGVQEESARHWIRSAIQHLAEGSQPRRVAAAAACLHEAARCTSHPNYRNWLRSMAAHLEKEVWS